MLNLLVKQLGVHVRLHNIIYHAIDDVKVLMAGLLEKIAQETEKGKALVKATFKSSQTGIIAGCQVTEGTIHRSNHIRVRAWTRSDLERKHCFSKTCERRCSRSPKRA